MTNPLVAGSLDADLQEALAGAGRHGGDFAYYHTFERAAGAAFLNGVEVAS
jgi:hypothetical protein